MGGAVRAPDPDREARPSESTDAHADPLEELTPCKSSQVMVEWIHEKCKGLTLGYGFIEVEQRIGHEKPGCQFHLVQTG